MSNRVTDRERYEAATALLHTYVLAVRQMRDLQIASRHWVGNPDYSPVNKAQEEVDSLTALHLLPPLPAPPVEVEQPARVEQLGANAEGLDFNGRGFIEPTYSVQIYANRVVVRMDDAQNKINWAELGITNLMIGEWFHALYADDEKDDARADFE